jgi:hypothetical protein
MDDNNIQQKGLHPIIKINIAAMTGENDMATIEDLMEAFDMNKSPVEFVKMLLDEGMVNIYLHSWDEQVKLL